MAPSEASPKPDPLEGTSGRRFVPDEEGAQPGDLHQRPRQEERESVDGHHIGYVPYDRQMRQLIMDGCKGMFNEDMANVHPQSITRQGR